MRALLVNPISRTTPSSTVFSICLAHIHHVIDHHTHTLIPSWSLDTTTQIIMTGTDLLSEHLEPEFSDRTELLDKRWHARLDFCLGWWGKLNMMWLVGWLCTMEVGGERRCVVRGSKKGAGGLISKGFVCTI